jgi:hypothetical protein
MKVNRRQIRLNTVKLVKTSKLHPISERLNIQMNIKRQKKKGHMMSMKIKRNQAM